MQISIIAAMGSNDVIGNKSRIPWHIPEDLKRFKELTMGHPIIMGRKTFESLPGLLPGRPHIIMTRNDDLQRQPGCYSASSIDEAIDAARMLCWPDSDEAFIIGGAEIYKAFLPIADRMYLTKIDLCRNGDTYFPSYRNDKWFTTKVNKSKNCVFHTLERSK